MVITGERRDEGGMRSVPRKDNTALCFTETADNKYRFRPLYYVSDKDKAWYKETYGIRYSDAYEVYGLTRTGCCGCPISYKAVDDLEKIGKYEPNVVKAAWNIFGKSYEYRRKYNEYKAARMEQEKQERARHGQTHFIKRRNTNRHHRARCPHGGRSGGVCGAGCREGKGHKW